MLEERILDVESVARALKELGHPTRLGIYRHLIRAGHAGARVGALQRSLGVPASTLSHHIAALVSVGLVKQERQGRALYCTAQYRHLQGIMAFLLEECCIQEQGENT